MKTKFPCRVEGCGKPASPGYFLCPQHYVAVPGAIQHELKRSNAISDTSYRWELMRRQKAAREKWIADREAERAANLPANDLRHEINRIRNSQSSKAQP